VPLIDAKIADQELPACHSSTYLHLKDDGEIEMSACDSGPLVDKWFGQDHDYEYWVTVPPSAAPKITFELLREKFSNQSNPVDAFRDWCKAHDIEHDFDIW
jgi:hypothetical protein